MLYQFKLSGPGNGVRPAFSIKFFDDVVYMCLSGSDTENETLSNLAVREADRLKNYGVERLRRFF